VRRATLALRGPCGRYARISMRCLSQVRVPSLPLNLIRARPCGTPALVAGVARYSGHSARAHLVAECGKCVKTICTTNTAWSATRRMVTALVMNLGPEAPGGRHAFPTAEAMAGADERFYKEVVRSGYRGPYFRAIAADVAAGRLDLEALLDPELPDDEVEARLLALPGVGPYATAQILMLLGRYSRLILDSWSRPKYAQLNGRKASDKTIDRRFRRYKQYAGLAFWLYVTRDWVTELPAGIK